MLSVIYYFFYELKHFILLLLQKNLEEMHNLLYRYLKRYHWWFCGSFPYV